MPYKDEEKSRVSSRARCKRYRQRHTEESRARDLAYRQAHPEMVSASQRKYRETHKEEILARRIARREETNNKLRIKTRAIREDVLTHYGKQCQCCGEETSEFLCIDHINGDGAAHRKVVRGSMYVWLKKNNFPDGFQVLCHNCNMAKGIYGECPHQRRELENESK